MPSIVKFIGLQKRARNSEAKPFPFVFREVSPVLSKHNLRFPFQPDANRDVEFFKF